MRMKKIRTICVLLIGSLFLLTLHLCKNSFIVKTRSLQITEREICKCNVTRKANTFSWPVCQQNKSVANFTNFKTLPGNIQDFLLHRHCRHFPIILDVPDKCGGPEKSADVFLFLVIKSSPENYDRREILRKTWAEERLHQGKWIRRVFISGTSKTGLEKETLNNLLKLEHSDYNDILQWDFNDSFFNLTLKQVLFLEWMQKNCPHARFLMNGDDDVFAHTDNMVSYLQGLKHNNGNKHLFTGHLISGVGPIRDWNSKYCVPVQVYKSDRYPPYCGGGGFILSGYTAMVIYNMSHSVTLLPIDDVYMGMCLTKAGLSPSPHVGVMTAGLHIPSPKIQKHHPCFYNEILLVHRFLPTQIYITWHQVHDPNLKCWQSSTETKRSQ